LAEVAKETKPEAAKDMKVSLRLLNAPPLLTPNPQINASRAALKIRERQLKRL
jgi:hypothetical protein